MNHAHAATPARTTVAVIGAGYWGRNLVRVYHGLGALAAVCDKNEELLAGVRESCPNVRTTLALNDVLGNDAVQAVAVATPAETHFHLAREALLAGKHVFVEKPLVLEPGEAEDLIEIARDRGLVLMVGHLLQYHPVFVRLRELAASGELGRINYIYSHRLNLGKIRREENILWSFAPHDISMILSLAGEEPHRVQATGGCYLHKSIADVTVTHLEFPSGLKAHIFVSWLHPFKEQKLVVVGERTMAVFDDTNIWPDKLLLYPHEMRWQGGVPVPVKGQPQRLDIPEEEPLLAECRHFLECVAEGRTPRTDGPEGLRVLRVLKRGQAGLDRPDGAAASRPGGVFVHETAVVEEDVRLGEGTRIWHFSHVLRGSRLGRNVNVGQNVAIGPDVAVGDGCKIQNNVSLYKGVTLEENVFCGPGAVFTNVFNPRAHVRRMDQIRPTRVGRGATLGANCTIVCGNSIGPFAFVGAGAVVTRDVPPHALVKGNPARRSGFVCECGERLGQNLRCRACGLSFRKSGEGLALAGD